MTQHVLTLRCNNRPGIVAAVATRLAEGGGDITEAAQFDDSLTGQFFMRVAFSMGPGISAFEKGFAEDFARFGMDWSLRPVEAAQAGADPCLDVRSLHGGPALPVADRRAADGRGGDRLEPSADDAGAERVCRRALLAPAGEPGNQGGAGGAAAAR